MSPSESTRSARVLVVDPSPAIGEAIAAALESGGHAVVFARSEEEGLNASLEGPFDVLFLHRGLGHAAAGELVRAIRTRAPDAMVILLCSHELNEAEKNQLRLGADQIVCKPLNPLEIRSVVGRCLQERRIETAPEKPRILVVDDDRMVLESVSDVLESAYDLSATSSPLEALRLLKDRPHHVLFTDWMMEEMNGMELIRSAMTIRPSILCIVMTGYGSKEVAIASVKEGAYDFIEKPLSPDQLRLTVSRAWRALRAELENRRLLAELRRTVDDLRSEMSERRRMQVRLAHADRMSTMGLLASGVAHEINNPLTYILYNLESLEKDLPGIVDAVKRSQRTLAARVGQEQAVEVLGEGQEELTRPDRLADMLERATEALDGARRVRDIVRDLKVFSCKEKDKLAQVQLNHVIESAANMAANEIKYRARLVKRYGDVPPVMASDGRLSQVFLNLLLNAAHAIDEGDMQKNEIRVRTWTAGGEVLASVQDSGRGVPPDQLGRIFEPFFTTKEAGVGSGLGLSICENIVTSYGGQIDVESEPGKGTRFIVRLPVAPQEAVTAAHAPADPELPCRRGRILVVDDEPGIAAVIRRMLIRDHDVVTARSGLEGKRILEEDAAFDLILCDLMMPEVTGMDLHEWLMERHADLARRTVFITGAAFTPRARAFLDRVPNLHVEKPFDVKNLRSLLQNLINLHG